MENEEEAYEVRPTTTITYTVKGMLERLDTKLDDHYARIIAKLDTKADAELVAGLVKKVQQLETADEKRTAVEAALLAAGKSALDRKRWLIPTLLSALYTGGAAAAIIYHVH